MMKFRKFFMLSALLTIFSLSCEVTPEEYEGEPNIYAILSADSSFACIMVGKTTSIDDTLALVPDTIMDTFWYDDTFEVWLEIVFPWNGISGAEVSLKHGGHRYIIIPIPFSSQRGKPGSLRLPILRGRRSRLRPQFLEASR